MDSADLRNGNAKALQKAKPYTPYSKAEQWFFMGTARDQSPTNNTHKQKTWHHTESMEMDKNKAKKIGVKTTLIAILVTTITGCSNPMEEIEFMEKSCPGYFSFTYSSDMLINSKIEVNCTETEEQRLKRVKKFKIKED